MTDGWPMWTWVPMAAVGVFLGGLLLVVGMAAIISIMLGIVTALRAFVGILASPLPERWRAWLVARGLAAD